MMTSAALGVDEPDSWVTAVDNESVHQGYCFRLGMRLE
jgi:hypothetical protein